VPTIADLIGQVERSWPAPAVQFGLVEGAGGVASPLATDGHTADLARALRADLVVLVADAGLGTINSVRLSVTALAPLPAVVYLNRFEPAEELHRRNLQWLAERDGFAVTTSVDHLADAVGRLGIGNKVEPPPHRSPVGPAGGESDVELAQLLGTAAEGDAG
jgi:dethiobiotin synthetase